MIVARVDYQMGAKNSIFGRILGAFLTQPTNFNGTDILSLVQPNLYPASRVPDCGRYLSDQQQHGGLLPRDRVRTLNIKTMPGTFNFADLGVQGTYYPANEPHMAPKLP